MNMRIYFLLVLLIPLLENLCLKQMNKGFHSDPNLVNLFSVTAMDYQNQPCTVIKYSVNELMSFRSVPRQLILPGQQVLTRLKGLGILQYRRKRSGRRKRSHCPRTMKPTGVNVNNLVYPKRCNTLSNLRENVNCLTLNCQSVIRKDVLVGQLLREEQTDFDILTETWFSDEKQHQFESSDLNQNGYKISVSNRKNRIGGGVALVCRSDINMRRISIGVKQSFEYGVWQLIFKNITIHCVGIYRPPSLATANQFMLDFCQFLEDLVPKNSSLM